MLYIVHILHVLTPGSVPAVGAGMVTVLAESFATSLQEKQ